MTLYAHSAKGGYDAQTYIAHVQGVTELARSNVRALLSFARYKPEDLLSQVEQAALYHDLGKLDDVNQSVLSGKVHARTLPLNHTDAGTAYWLSGERCNPFIAVLIRSHHKGFPDFPAEMNRGNLIFRDEQVSDHIDKNLAKYTSLHNNLMSDFKTNNPAMVPSAESAMLFRILLSCLVDADHTNTAVHYGGYHQNWSCIHLRAKERLAALDAYVAKLQATGEATERNRLRGDFYASCRNQKTNEGIVSCDSPVGTGKTTAIMANLLMQAWYRNLRRIFVVLPFTNIIQQSVEVYRDALTLPGENPSDVVAELHHRADFESVDARHLSALWRAPIIVTTAVAFFETLASNTPSGLRRLHELPGSAIFVDESHAALPAHLLPITWRWMNELADNWNCYWVLASGSLARFWEIPDISDQSPQRNVPEIANAHIRNLLSAYEINRVSYHSDLTPKNQQELMDWFFSFSGPRLVILNTVQSAGVLANFVSEQKGRESVEHLSTALTPVDRDITLKRVRKRLRDPNDRDWVLVATSCVEAGVNLSFRHGFREIGSLSSLLQASGRVNREGLYQDSQMWCFSVLEDGIMKRNPGLKNAATVLKDYFDNGLAITPDLTTQSIADEIAQYGLSGSPKQLLSNERIMNFRQVERDFRVINSDTCMAVIDEESVRGIQENTIDWQHLQRISVHIAKYKLEELGMPRINDNVYQWTLAYNSFLGYMAGIIEHMSYGGNVLLV
jgi:CRISPR-associated endonuclease/helicase Cas3